ncbi:MAG: polyprenol monophosphomannose synthase [Rhodothermales bacterium]
MALTPTSALQPNLKPASTAAGRSVVVVPTFNEAANILHLLDGVMSLPSEVSVIVVDDGSPDGTANLVRSAQARFPKRIDLIERVGKQGLGSAYLRGFSHALNHGFDYICEIDADLSHNPKDLPRLIAPVRSGAADLTIGSRYVGGVRVINWPLSRLVLSYGAGVYTRLITGLPLFDVTAGFKCFHRRVLETIPFGHVRSNGYSFQVEMSYRTWKKGFRVREVPIVFTERTEGQSKMSRAIVVEAALKVWELRLRDLAGAL